MSKKLYYRCNGELVTITEDQLFRAARRGGKTFMTQVVALAASPSPEFCGDVFINVVNIKLEETK